jgi:RHS repeat-associated protein
VEKRNIETGERRVFTWDYRNRLTAVERYESDDDADPERVEYRYDPLDRRIATTQDGETIWTYYDGAQPVADYRNLEAEPERLYFTGERDDELLAIWRRDEGMYHVVTDHLGSVEAVLDAGGNAVARYEYDAFGNLLTAEGDRPELAGRFGFVGRERDAVSGCYWLRARWYDPEIGRFLSPDPLEFAAGDGNLYRYARNQPLSQVDRSGTISAAEYTILVEAFSLGVLLFLYCDIVKGVGDLWAYVAIHVINALNGNPLPPAPPGKGGLPSAVTGPLPTWEDLLPVNPGCLHD